MLKGAREKLDQEKRLFLRGVHIYVTHRDKNRDRDAHRLIFTVSVHAVWTSGQMDRMR